MYLQPTKENTTNALEIIHELIMKLCPELTEGECNYFRFRYENLSQAQHYNKDVFNKVFNTVISETCSKLKRLK